MYPLPSTVLDHNSTIVLPCSLWPHFAEFSQWTYLATVFVSGGVNDKRNV